MTAWTGLVLALGVLAPLVGCVLTYCKQVRGHLCRSETEASGEPALVQEHSLALLRQILKAQEVEQ